MTHPPIWLLTRLKTSFCAAWNPWRRWMRTPEVGVASRDKEA